MAEFHAICTHSRYRRYRTVGTGKKAGNENHGILTHSLTPSLSIVYIWSMMSIYTCKPVALGAQTRTWRRKGIGQYGVS